MTFQEFMDKVGELSQNAFVDVGEDGELIVYSGLELLTDSDNPSIPAGETVLQDIQVD